MGEAAEDILDGTVCECCGQFLDDIINGGEPPGYPRRCGSCGPPRKLKLRKRQRKPRQETAISYAWQIGTLCDFAGFSPHVLPEVEKDRQGHRITMHEPGGGDATAERIGNFGSREDAERSLRLAGYVPLTRKLWRFRPALED